jgi:hypothetical protein
MDPVEGFLVKLCVADPYPLRIPADFMNTFYKVDMNGREMNPRRKSYGAKTFF